VCRFIGGFSRRLPLASPASFFVSAVVTAKPTTEAAVGEVGRPLLLRSSLNCCAARLMEQVERERKAAVWRKASCKRKEEDVLVDTSRYIESDMAADVNRLPKEGMERGVPSPACLDERGFCVASLILNYSRPALKFSHPLPLPPATCDGELRGNHSGPACVRHGRDLAYLARIPDVTKEDTRGKGRVNRRRESSPLSLDTASGGNG